MWPTIPPTRFRRLPAHHALYIVFIRFDSPGHTTMSAVPPLSCQSNYGHGGVSGRSVRLSALAEGVPIESGTDAGSRHSRPLPPRRSGRSHRGSIARRTRPRVGRPSRWNAPGRSADDGRASRRTLHDIGTHHRVRSFARRSRELRTPWCVEDRVRRPCAALANTTSSGVIPLESRRDQRSGRIELTTADG